MIDYSEGSFLFALKGIVVYLDAKEGKISEN